MAWRSLMYFDVPTSSAVTGGQQRLSCTHPCITALRPATAGVHSIHSMTPQDVISVTAELILLGSVELCCCQ
jgi:hypothetical protein